MLVIDMDSIYGLVMHHFKHWQSIEIYQTWPWTCAYDQRVIMNTEHNTHIIFVYLSLQSNCTAVQCIASSQAGRERAFSQDYITKRWVRYSLLGWADFFSLPCVEMNSSDDHGNSPRRMLINGQTQMLDSLHTATHTWKANIPSRHSVGHTV